jgi:hypothetical protein
MPGEERDRERKREREKERKREKERERERERERDKRRQILAINAATTIFQGFQMPVTVCLKLVTRLQGEENMQGKRF